MSAFTDTLARIRQGLQGHNKGVNFGLNKVSRFIPNIQPKRITTICAGSGVGKTTLAIYMYIFSPYEAYIRDSTTDYKCIFYTLEIDMVSVIAKLISMKLYADYRILISPDIMFSSTPGQTLPSNILALIESYAEYFERLEEIIEFIDEPTNPTGISKRAEEFALESGRKVYYKRDGSECEHDDPLKYRWLYVPNNPRQVRQLIIDHSGCLKKEQEARSNKEKIDLMCEKMVYSRNKLMLSWCVLSQLNRSLEGAERQMHTSHKKNYELLVPGPADLKDTGNLFESSDVVIYGFNPFDYGIPEFAGYKIAEMKDRFRIIGIMKNRYGRANIMTGYGYIGEASFFVEIPESSAMTSFHYNVLANIGRDETLNLTHH